ncbi:four helix bundle protein [Patescibacteria group bacterium]|nr:four helix bundle protein [Patescibacteria group bacterium]MBU3999869.1 four helix bundle protein [Patescibacteria group bacterium]MBU4056401.1 four helix bundle protein [Patescibacteria group bacterium]MBU4368719.1 four helix bundle protein [Patescibacteria group bacterium]
MPNQTDKITNSKPQITDKTQAANIPKTQTNYRDLEERTLEFAKKVIYLCKSLPKNTIGLELIKQIIRSACSVGANYREANEALGKKDFVHRLRISRKEAKETTHWLELILEANPEFKQQIQILIKETQELRNIISAIIDKANAQ